MVSITDIVTYGALPVGIIALVLYVYVERFAWDAELKSTKTIYQYTTGIQTIRNTYSARFAGRLPMVRSLCGPPEIDTFKFTDGTFSQVQQTSGDTGQLKDGEDWFTKKEKHVTKLFISKQRFPQGRHSVEFAVEVIRYKSRAEIDSFLSSSPEDLIRENGTVVAPVTVLNSSEYTVTDYEFSFSVPNLDGLTPAYIRRSDPMGVMQDCAANPIDFVVRLDVIFPRLTADRTKSIELIGSYQVMAFVDVPPGKTTVAIRYRTPTVTTNRTPTLAPNPAPSVT